MIETFHFLRPYWLLALLPLLAILWRLNRVRQGAGMLQRLCDPALLPFLLIDRPGLQSRQASSWLLGAGGLLAILALAGPVWERLPVPVFRNADALVIVMDLSLAMDATDLQPSRLDRARYKIADLLRLRRDGQTGLVVYSGDAFTVTPLTDDVATIASQVGALSTELVPVQGQRLDLGLEAALRLLRQGGVQTGHVLVMTSDVDTSAALDAARKVREQGYRLSVLGFGTEAGGPVRLGRRGLWKDASGNILVPKLNAAALRQIAEQGDGLYRTATADNADIDRLSSFFERSSAQAREGGDSQAELDQWVERGPWLVLLLLPLAALAFRRGSLFVLPLLVGAWSDPGEALTWQDLWTKPDHRGSEAFQREQFEDAARAFDDPAWRGAAWYKAGKYQEALQALKDVNTPEAWYNQGNALARLGQFAEAIAAYGKVLEREPGHADAKYNKELLEQYMKKKEQKQQKESNSGDQQGQQDSGQQDEQQKQDQKDQQKQEQQGEQKPEPSEQDRAADKHKDSEGQPDSRQSDQASSDQPEPTPADQQPEEEQGKEAPQTSAEKENVDEKSSRQSETELSEQREVQQANEQWLRRIPDDPAGLLRRKFAWQYRQRQRMTQEGEP